MVDGNVEFLLNSLFCMNTKNTTTVLYGINQLNRHNVLCDNIIEQILDSLQIHIDVLKIWKRRLSSHQPIMNKSSDNWSQLNSFKRAMSRLGLPYKMRRSLWRRLIPRMFCMSSDHLIHSNIITNTGSKFGATLGYALLRLRSITPFGLFTWVCTEEELCRVAEISDLDWNTTDFSCSESNVCVQYNVLNFCLMNFSELKTLCGASCARKKIELLMGLNYSLDKSLFQFKYQERMLNKYLRNLPRMRCKMSQFLPGISSDISNTIVEFIGFNYFWLFPSPEGRRTFS